jgi:hypothetical protein
MRRRPRFPRRSSARRADRPASWPVRQSASSSSSSRRSGMRGCQPPGTGPDHRTGVELATFDPHRAARATAAVQRRLDDGVGREARWGRFEVRELRDGRAAPSAGTSSAAGHNAAISAALGIGMSSLLIDRSPLVDADATTSRPSRGRRQACRGSQRRVARSPVASSDDAAGNAGRERGR